MEATAAAAAAAAGAEGARAAEVVARRREGRAAAMTAAEGLEAEAREEGTEYCGRAERRTGRADAGRADAGSAIRRSEAIFIRAEAFTADAPDIMAVVVVGSFQDLPRASCSLLGFPLIDESSRARRAAKRHQTQMECEARL